MKKLLIATAIAVGALASQAASFVWGTTGKAYSIADTTMNAGLAAGQTYGVGSNNAASMANQIASYNATWTYAITLTKGASSEVLNGTLEAGDFSSRAIYKTGLSSTLFDGASGDNPAIVDYSIVITGTVTDGQSKTWEITSDTIIGQQTYTGIGDLNIETAGPTQWTAAPEPTSGLMLLLGVAGLALRRKRA